ncbi:MAG: hypothetical protein WC307_03510 [Candidatus Nanoarchaeia archaeon]|jgi:hypothetical protein
MVNLNFSNEVFFCLPVSENEFDDLMIGLDSLENRLNNTKRVLSNNYFNDWLFFNSINISLSLLEIYCHLSNKTVNYLSRFNDLTDEHHKKIFGFTKDEPEVRSKRYSLFQSYNIQLIPNNQEYGDSLKKLKIPDYAKPNAMYHIALSQNL